MISINIAIPSYKRSKLLKEKTLNLLTKLKVDSKDITIFIRDEDELEDYIRDCDDSHSKYKYIITNARGIKNTRNYLRNYYHKQELDLVLFIDDDIDKFEKYCDNLVSVDNLHETLQYIYEETKKLNLKFFGICGFNNAFFMKNTISTNLKYIIGAFCGLIEPHKQTPLECSIDHGEDFQFSLKHFIADGGVARFNMYCITTKYYRKDGGICEDLGGIEKRNENAKESLTYLENTYPGMCKVIKKKNGNWDLRLNYHYKH